MRRASCLVLMILVLVAQSGALQVGAWMSMAVEQASINGWSAGVLAPLGPACGMCKVAKALSAAPEEGLPMTSVKKDLLKMDVVPPVVLVVAEPSPAHLHVGIHRDLGGVAQWGPTPELPPPRHS